MSDSDDGPNEHRPIVDMSIEAEATAHTRPIVGEDYDQRTGTVETTTKVVVECPCDTEVTIHSIQGGATCQGCGRRWKLED
jgi:hypothetical protein